LIQRTKAKNAKKKSAENQDSDRIQLLISSSLTLALFGPWVRRRDQSTATGAVMDEVSKPELEEAISSLAGPFAQVSSDATRRLCEQGQSVAKTINEWTTEVSHFLSHRAARNGEVLGRMTKCQNVPEVFAIQSEWARDVADDYMREMSKLMEINSRLMSGMLGSVGKIETQPSTEPRPSTVRESMRAAE
jgi:hypothetical protein